MMNLTNSTKATIAKIDNGAYHSFNAYVRPKRVKSEYRLNPNARVINLDPTNNPDEVCNAYRAIQIESQLKRIAKNEQRLAERRRIAGVRHLDPRSPGVPARRGVGAGRLAQGLAAAGRGTYQDCRARRQGASLALPLLP